jgi:hypothetical protein
MLIIPVSAVTIRVLRPLGSDDVDMGCSLLVLARRPRGRFFSAIGLLSPVQKRYYIFFKCCLIYWCTQENELMHFLYSNYHYHLIYLFNILFFFWLKYIMCLINALYVALLLETLKSNYILQWSISMQRNALGIKTKL